MKTGAAKLLSGCYQVNDIMLVGRCHPANSMICICCQANERILVHNCCQANATMLAGAAKLTTDDRVSKNVWIEDGAHPLVDRYL